MGCQGCFYLTELDAVAANLDLKVGATQKLYVAVRHEACQIARFVQTCTGTVAERIGDEALSRQFGPVQVSPCHLDSTDV